MAWLREIGRRLGMLLRRGQFERELREEMQLHAELRGDTRRFGNELRLREASREAWGWRWLDEWGQDVRYALRTLRRTPVVAAAALLSLTLGIGANMALFSLAHALLLRPLPVPHPEQLLQVVLTPDRIAGHGFPNPVWEQIRDRQDVFSHAFALGDAALTLRRGNVSSAVSANWAGGDFFATLEQKPALGRFFTAQDDYRGCPGVAVLGYGFWHSQFADSAAVIGTTMQLSGQPFQIIGVAKQGFFGAEVGNAFDVVAPLCSEARVAGRDSMLDSRSQWGLTILGRLRPGVTRQEADARLGGLGTGIFSQFALPGQPTGPGLGVETGARGFLNVPTGYPEAITALLCIAGMLLLVACANLASLMLARAGARRQEMRVRRSLGASRARLLRQGLTESLLLASGGALAGFVSAGWAAGAIEHAAPDGVTLNLSLDWQMLAFTAGLALITGLLCGGWPAWRAGQDRSKARKESERDTGPRRWIVVSQVAVALLLLTESGLFLHSFANLVAVAPGFDPHSLVLVNLHPGTAMSSNAGRDREYALALMRLRAIPGVSAASASFLVPVTGMGWRVMVKPELAAPWRPVAANAVSPGYFTTLRTPWLGGRDFAASDGAGAPPVAIINRRLAHELFPNGPALGHLLYWSEAKAGARIVGVVADARYAAIASPAPLTAYFPLAQSPPTFANFELRSPLASRTIEAAAQRALAGLDPSAALRFDTLAAEIGASLAQPRLLAAIAGLFGGLGLLLTAIGLYGVVSYDVERRRREFGVRLALGAAPGSLWRLVLGELFGLMAAGALLGGVVAWMTGHAAAHAIHGLLYGLGAEDAATVAGAAAVLAAVALLAAALPARRAARVDPMVSLREE